MASVEFQYNGSKTVIQCEEGQKMEEICNNFINKTKANKNNIYYIYNGKSNEQFNKQLNFDQMANNYDKIRRKMSILVNDIYNSDENKSKLKSKNIICPECNEDILINIKDYKINLSGCKNKHKINNILFNEFEKTQIIDLEKIKCEICKENNKSNTYHNLFYKCYECNINLCPLCKTKHNNNHNISNYDKINITCKIHNELFTNYCKKCKINICYLCEEKHKKHEVILLRKMMVDKDELILKLRQIKETINILKNDISKIMEIINNVKENLDNYYRIEENIFNNYDKNERNYEILYNINELMNFNNIIQKDINNENNVENTFNNIYNIYNLINRNEIKLTLNIQKEDVNKEIYFLDNTDGKVPINTKEFKEYHHDFLKELNEKNVELYINKKKFKFQKYFKPKKKGIYDIFLKFKIIMEDCGYMFYNCSNIIDIDLSLFNTKIITNMICFCYGCFNLKNINLTSFNTESVKNMSGLFYNCSNLENINFSSFNTKNVINMSAMLMGCSNLLNIDLSSFDTKNVTNMEGMFFGCANLIDINLSSFNTENVINVEGMFYGCKNLTELDLSSFNTKNVLFKKGLFYKSPSLKAIKLNTNSCSTIIDKIEDEKIKIISI